MRKFTVILLMIMIPGLAITRLIGKPVGMKAIGVILSGKVKPVLFLLWSGCDQPEIGGWLLGCLELERGYEYDGRNRSR